MKSGIYFDMPEDVYHAEPALSRGGLCDMLESPLTYWVKSVHNPKRPEDEQTEESVFGSACHARVLLGKDEFQKRYAPEADKRDFPNALHSGEQLRARCKELGLPRNGSLLEMSERIREEDDETELFPLIKKDYEDARGDRIPMSQENYDNVEMVAQAIHADPESSALVSNGWSEVSIFWEEQFDGFTVPMKARLDYLKVTPEGWKIADLKTFGTRIPGKPVKQSAISTIGGGTYGMQAVTYVTGVKEIGRLIEKGLEVELPSGVEWKKPEHVSFTFLMVRTGHVPDTLLFEYTKAAQGERMAYWHKWANEYETQVSLHRRFAMQYGYDKPWIEPAEVVTLRDEDFPIWAL